MKNNLKINKNLEECLKCLSLCHSAKTFYSKDLDKNFVESYSKEEEIILNYLENVGRKLERVQADYYELKINNIIHRFKILGINYFNEKRRRFSIICENSNSGSEPILYCKGPFESMKDIMKFSNYEKRNLEN